MYICVLKCTFGFRARAASAATRPIKGRCVALGRMDQSVVRHPRPQLTQAELLRAARRGIEEMYADHPQPILERSLYDPGWQREVISLSALEDEVLLYPHDGARDGLYKVNGQVFHRPDDEETVTAQVKRALGFHSKRRRSASPTGREEGDALAHRVLAMLRAEEASDERRRMQLMRLAHTLLGLALNGPA